MRLMPVRNRRRSERAQPLQRLRRILRGLLFGARLALPALASGALVAWAGLGVADYARTTPYFRVRQVEVQGLARLDEAEVLRWAGLGPRTHLLTLSLADLQRRLEAHPWIARAEVERELPDRLELRLRERQPKARLLGDRLYLVDEAGTVFDSCADARCAGLPIITGLDLSQASSQGLALRDQLHLALSVITEWQRQGLAEVTTLSELHMDPSIGPVLFVGERGTRVQLGDSEHPLRLARLRAVLEDLRRGGKAAEYVLLDTETATGRVTVGLAPASAAAAGGQG